MSKQIPRKISHVGFDLQLYVLQNNWSHSCTGICCTEQTIEIIGHKAHDKKNKMNTDYKNKENATDLCLHGDEFESKIDSFSCLWKMFFKAGLKEI